LKGAKPKFNLESACAIILTVLLMQQNPKMKFQVANVGF